MEERRMTFRQHLEELRTRLRTAVLTVLGTLVVCAVFMPDIAAFVIHGPHDTAYEYLKADEDFTDDQRSQVRTRLMGGTYQAPFIAYFKLAFIVALFLASPMIGYQIWKFISAGLYVHEQKAVLYFAPLSLALFVTGCLFGFFVLIPFALYWLVKIADPTLIEPLFQVGEYLNLVMLLTLVLGAVFQLPLVMVFFAKIGLASPKGYLKYWKVAIIAIFVTGALLTPPDPISQCMMAGPMLILYFAGVGLSALVYKKKE